jgi:hypothetical protein
MSAAFPSPPTASTLSKSDAFIRSAKCANRDRPPPSAGSSVRVCRPSQPSETRALGALAWKIASVAVNWSLSAR